MRFGLIEIENAELPFATGISTKNQIPDPLGGSVI
jgi:hypothetical protein